MGMIVRDRRVVVHSGPPWISDDRQVAGDGDVCDAAVRDGRCRRRGRDVNRRGRAVYQAAISGPADSDGRTGQASLSVRGPYCRHPGIAQTRNVVAEETAGAAGRAAGRAKGEIARARDVRFGRRQRGARRPVHRLGRRRDQGRASTSSPAATPATSCSMAAAVLAAWFAGLIGGMTAVITAVVLNADRLPRRRRRPGHAPRARPPDHLRRRRDRDGRPRRLRGVRPATDWSMRSTRSPRLPRRSRRAMPGWNSCSRRRAPASGSGTSPPAN